MYNGEYDKSKKYHRRNPRKPNKKEIILDFGDLKWVDKSPRRTFDYFQNEVLDLLWVSFLDPRIPSDVQRNLVDAFYIMHTIDAKEL